MIPASKFVTYLILSLILIEFIYDNDVISQPEAGPPHPYQNRSPTPKLKAVGFSCKLTYILIYAQETQK